MIRDPEYNRGYNDGLQGKEFKEADYGGPYGIGYRVGNTGLDYMKYQSKSWTDGERKAYANGYSLGVQHKNQGRLLT